MLKSIWFILFIVLSINLSSFNLYGQKNSITATANAGWYKADILFNDIHPFSGNTLISSSVNTSFGLSYLHFTGSLGVGGEIFYEPLRYTTRGLRTSDEIGETIRNYYEQKINFISIGIPIAYKFGEEYSSSFFFATITPKYKQLIKNVAAVRDSSGNTFESTDEFGLIYKDESQLSYSLMLGYRWKLNDSFRKSGWALGIEGFFEQYLFLRSSNETFKFAAGISASLIYAF